MQTRFVVLHHLMPSGSRRASHWDIMVEGEGHLITWAIEGEPYSSFSQEAIMLPKHRLEYLDYQGPVSNGRGSVKRWDSGFARIVSQENDRWLILFFGEKFIVEGSFQRIDQSRWTIQWKLGENLASSL